MKNKNSRLMSAMSSINVTSIVICLVGCVYAFSVTNKFQYRIITICEMIMLVSSALYLLKGFKKDAAKYYKLFMALYASIHLIEILAYQLDPNATLAAFASPIEIVVSMIIYGNTLLLAFGKDLGKTVSLSLSGFNCIAYLLCFIAAIIGLIPFDGVNPIAARSIYFTWLVIAMVAFIMTTAKYIDKASRNTN